MDKEIKKKHRRVPEGIDLSDLEYLEYGDLAIVANELNMDKQYVGRVRNLKSYSVKVLAALLKRGAHNRKLLNETR